MGLLTPASYALNALKGIGNSAKDSTKKATTNTSTTTKKATNASTTTPTTSTTKTPTTPKIDVSEKSNTGTGVYDSQKGANMSQADIDAIAAAGLKYKNAETTAQKSAAHDEAEKIRAKYNYSGGVDGSNYVAITPKQYDMGLTGGDGSSLNTQINDVLSKVLSKSEFSYDAEKDEAFQRYKEQMIDAGQKAYGSSVAGASIPGVSTNSVAEQIAQGANTAYLNKIGDAEQTFFDKAYNRYLQDSQTDNNNLSTLMNINNISYNRGQDTKNRDYQTSRDNVADSQWNTTFDYNKGQDAIANALNKEKLALDAMSTNASISNMAADNARQDRAANEKKATTKTDTEKPTYTTSQISSQANSLMNSKNEDGAYAYTISDVEKWLSDTLPNTPEGDKQFDDIMRALNMQYPNRTYKVNNNGNIHYGEPIGPGLN